MKSTLLLVALALLVAGCGAEGTGGAYARARRVMRRMVPRGRPDSNALPVVAFTFDDGWKEVYANAFPAMQGHPATSFIISSRVGGVKQASAEQLVEMADSGWSIGNHTWHHVHLDAISKDSARVELDSCREFLNSLGLSGASSHVAYPWGDCNSTTDSAMEEGGYLTGRTCDNAYELLPFAEPLHLNVKVGTDLARLRGYVDVLATKAKTSMIIVFHHIEDTAVQGDIYTWCNKDSLSALVDYVEAKGTIRFMNIEELYEEQKKW